MGVKLSISIKQNSQSAANNTSNVTVGVVATWDYGSFNRTQKPGYLVIDGKKYTFNAPFNSDESKTGSETIFSRTDNIEHGSTGAKTLACSASYTTGVSSGTITATASKTLTTIPRASTPTVSSSSVNMGSKVTINTNRASSSFTHDLAYSFAGGSYVSIATGVGDSYEWTTPDLASKIPSATSGTVTIRCITKSGGTAIGTKTVTMTLKVPTTVVPTISAVAVVEATSGLAAQFGAFIKTKSKIKATVTAAGAKGSTIKSYSTTFNGKTYTGSSWTSDIVSASGSLSLVTTVTDSRGRTAKKTTTITVLDYSKPVVDELHAYRVNAAGVADPNGVYIAVKYRASITSLNKKNTFSGKIEYKRSTDTAWGTLVLLTGDGSVPTVQGTAKPTSPTFSTDYQYDVRLSCSDYFGAASPYIVQLPSGAVILDIAADGKGIGIGKTSEREGLEVAWPTFLSGSVYHSSAWSEWLDGGTGEKVLYTNNAGTAEAITLPVSAEKFRFLEIYYTDNNGKAGGYTSVYNPDGKTVCLQLQEAGSNVYIRQTSYTISGTSVTPDTENASYVRFTAVSGYDPVTISKGTNYIKIVRVVGRA